MRLDEAPLGQEHRIDTAALADSEGGQSQHSHEGGRDPVPPPRRRMRPALSGGVQPLRFDQDQAHA
jgi:hypothetical protein